MNRLSLHSILRGLGLSLHTRQPDDGRDIPFVIDSRRVGPGAVFFCLPGTRTDGHEFAVAAAQAGALAVVALKGRLDAEAGGTVKALGCALIEVEDVLACLQALAQAWRARWSCPVVGVTGSAGKTTTREMLRFLLEKRWRTASATGNLNNHIGMPLSLLNAPEASQVGVFEVGINHPGEMEPLAAILAPTLAVIVTVGAAHLEELGSVAGVAREKTGLLRALPAAAACWVPEEPVELEPCLAGLELDVRRVGWGEGCAVRLLSLGGGRARFLVQGRELDLELPEAGDHLLRDAVQAVAVAVHLGLDGQEACLALKGFRGVAQRGQWLKLGGVLVCDDSYNANVLSLKAALETVSQRARAEGRRLVVVAGEMLEMGGAREAVHREVGEAAARTKAAWLVFVGGANPAYREGALAGGHPAGAIRCFDNAEAAAEWARENVADGDLWLIKGSRGVHTEVVRQALQEGR
jgi:UDP-N-acetylmuramoyl-tripeptide--D-alanyl-D-alanine ligase